MPSPLDTACIFRTLADHDVRYVLIGGLAAVLVAAIHHITRSEEAADRPKDRTVLPILHAPRRDRPRLLKVAECPAVYGCADRRSSQRHGASGIKSSGSPVHKVPRRVSASAAAKASA